MISNEEKKYLLRSSLTDVKRNLRLLIAEQHRCEKLGIATPTNLHRQIGLYAGRFFRLREIFREELI